MKKFTRPVIDAIDHRNTKDGGCVSPTKLTLPPFLVQRLIKGTDDMQAEARKLEQKSLRDEAKPWKPRPLIVDSRQAKPPSRWVEPALYVALAGAYLLTMTYIVPAIIGGRGV